MIETYSISLVYSLMLIFSRIGSAFLVMPGISETYVNSSVRLVLALLVSMLLAPIMSSHLPPMPDSPLMLMLLILNEVVIGLFIGTITRLLVSTINVLGMIIATQSGLGSAILFDPSQGDQGAILGNFMTMMAVTLIFVTDMHYIMLRGLAQSYYIFTPGKLPDIGDMSNVIAHTVSNTFEIAIKMAAPQLVVGLIVLLGGGILARLMPSMQIFFLLIPLQILISLFVLTLTLSAGMMWYLGYFEDTLNSLFSL